MKRMSLTWRLASILGAILILQALAYADVFSDTAACGASLWSCWSTCDPNPNHSNSCADCIYNYGGCMSGVGAAYQNVQYDVCGAATYCASGCASGYQSCGGAETEGCDEAYSSCLEGCNIFQCQ